MSNQEIAENEGYVVVDSTQDESITSEATTEQKAFRQLTDDEKRDIQAEIERASTEFQEHKYLVSTERSFLTKCTNFIDSDVKFDGKDALGVIRLYTALKEASEESSTLKSEEYEFRLSNMHLEALYYYLQKNTGTGFSAARKLATIIEPVLMALTDARIRNSKLQSYVEKLNAKLHGIIDPDEDITLNYGDENTAD